MFYWKSPKHLILRSLKLKRWLSKSKQYTLGYQKKHLCITFITSPGVNLWTYSAVKSNSKVNVFAYQEEALQLTPNNLYPR